MRWRDIIGDILGVAALFVGGYLAMLIGHGIGF